MTSRMHPLLTRRDALKSAAAAGAGLALAHLPHAMSLDAQGAAILKAIPKGGEKLPVIGLGTNAYSVKTTDEMGAAARGASRDAGHGRHLDRHGARLRPIRDRAG